MALMTKMQRSCSRDVVRCSVPMLYCLNDVCVPQHTSSCFCYLKLVSLTGENDNNNVNGAGDDIDDDDDDDDDRAGD